MLGCTIRTPDTGDGLLRDMVLRDMDRPVTDTSRKGHFVPAHQTRAVIKRGKMDFERLKAELPQVDSHPLDTADKKMRDIADVAAGGTKLFKGERVREVVVCSGCSKVRCIYSLYALQSKHNKLSKNAQKEKLAQLEAFKNGAYVCGDKCPVEPFVTKQSMRCGQFMESMYYGFARKKGNLSIICCHCSNDEDIVPKVEVMEKLNTNKKTPLPICRDCFDRNISPPIVNSVTNFVQKAALDQSRKKRQLDSTMEKGYRVARSKK